MGLEWGWGCGGVVCVCVGGCVCVVGAWRCGAGVLGGSGRAHKHATFNTCKTRKYARQPPLEPVWPDRFQLVVDGAMPAILSASGLMFGLMRVWCVVRACVYHRAWVCVDGDGLF